MQKQFSRNSFVGLPNKGNFFCTKFSKRKTFQKTFSQNFLKEVSEQNADFSFNCSEVARLVIWWLLLLTFFSLYSVISILSRNYFSFFTLQINRGILLFRTFMLIKQ